MLVATLPAVYHLWGSVRELRAGLWPLGVHSALGEVRHSSHCQMRRLRAEVLGE